jgi:predicted amidophosphoribosyltransferase
MLALVRAWLFPPACVACDAPGPALCARCAPRPEDAAHFAIDGIPAFALGSYEGALRSAIVAMKRGARDPLDAFAALLERAPLAGALVPLPTTRRRIAERGFDQSVELARRLAARRGVPSVELLAKHGRPQEGRNRVDRLAARDRFRLRPGIAAPPVATLLDDVCTTGTTLRDAARTLRAAGVEVRAIVVVAHRGGTSGTEARS